MDSGSKFLTFTSIVVLALILQVLLAVADQRDTPEKAAREFAQAYFWLDGSMTNRLCKQLSAGSGGQVVEDYLQRVDRQARASGFGFDYMKQDLYHLDFKTELKDATSAEVKLTGIRKRAINPVFGMIARLFFVGETHSVEEGFQLVKEGDQWKICGRPFALIEG